MNKFPRACFGLVVLLLVVLVIPTRLAASEGTKSDCYPLNTIVIDKGDTSAKGEATGTVGEIEVERHGAVADYGPSKVTVEFGAKIKDGGSQQDEQRSKSTGQILLQGESQIRRLLRDVCKRSRLLL